MWKWRLGDFPGCPVGKTLCFHCRELRSQMLCIVAKKKKNLEAGDGITLSKTKEYVRVPESERGKEGFFPTGWEVSMVLPHLDFRLLASRTLRQHISMWVCQHISVNFHDTFFFSSLTRDWTCAPAAEVQSLNHWTSREVPYDTSSQQS